MRRITFGLLDYGYRTVIFFCYRTIKIVAGITVVACVTAVACIQTVAGILAVAGVLSVPEGFLLLLSLLLLTFV
jgi:hypothetical protein